MRSTRFPSVLLSIGLLLATPFALPDAALDAGSASGAPVAPPDSRTFEVDGQHSSVMFRVKHLGVAWFYGRFNKVSGSFVLDPSNLDKSFVKVEIDAASVDTNSSGRNNHLMSPAFFAAKQYAKLTFASTKVSKVGKSEFQITGDLTIRDKTQSITVRATHTGARDAGRRFGYRAGWSAEFPIKRSTYGVSWGVQQGVLGDDVNLWISLEGTPAK